MRRRNNRTALTIYTTVSDADVNLRSIRIPTALILMGVFAAVTLVSSILVAADSKDDAANAPTDPPNAEETEVLSEDEDSSSPQVPESETTQNDESTATIPRSSAAELEVDDEEEPWDFAPYRVLIWIASDSPNITASSVGPKLQEFLDRQFFAIWRIDIQDAPAAVAINAERNLEQLSYEAITASDPVLAIKRDHKDAVRLRVAQNVAELIPKIFATSGQIEEAKRRGVEAGNETLDGVADKLVAVDGDATSLIEMWSESSTEGILVSRGMAETLESPKAKIISLPVSQLVAEAVENYDKIFVVRVNSSQTPTEIATVELDTLMRFFGPPASKHSLQRSWLAAAIGHSVISAFAPTVRIENAGKKSAEGLLRAGGLVLNEDSPAMIKVGDVLRPLTRKNDRNDNPILIGLMDWAYLIVKEQNGSRNDMDFYAGRAGGLQGRKNKRTFKTALRVRRFGESTTIRLHKQREPDFPLIGYEIYERELESKDMSFIGRTDWNGRLPIKTAEDKPLRLLYVKNGGAILARLPLVPGLMDKETADLSGDDMRLQAEAYIRGVQNAIIDLIAIRELLAARIRLRLKKGQMREAEELLFALRDQPTNKKLATDMGKKQSMFLKALGTKNANQRRKVDDMFVTTRELLSKHINPKKIRELEEDMLRAKQNGGKLPDDSSEEEQTKVVDMTKGDPADQ